MNVQRAAQNMNNISDAFLARLVQSESMTIKTNELAVALRKVSSHEVKGLSMNEGPVKFELPGNLGKMDHGEISAKVRATCDRL